MNNKLAIGIAITGFVYLIFLLMTYSSSEHAANHRNRHASGSTPNSVVNPFRNKQLLLFEGNTITIADADVLNDAYVNAAHFGEQQGRDAAAQAVNDMQTEIDDYKGLIGPGPNTVLGMPKNNNGGNLGQAPNNRRADRESWGSHGILGDLYRYSGSSSMGNVQSRAWGGDGTAGGGPGSRWRNGRPTSDCSNAQCDAHAQGDTAAVGNHSWERVRLRSDEELPDWHNSL